MSSTETPKKKTKSINQPEKHINHTIKHLNFIKVLVEATVQIYDMSTKGTVDMPLCVKNAQTKLGIFLTPSEILKLHPTLVTFFQVWKKEVAEDTKEKFNDY